MVKNHIKTLTVPTSWPVQRKEKKYVTKPKPGPHSLALGISLSLLLTDMIKLVSTRKEARYILNNHEVLVDGRRRKDIRFMVGLMDVVSIPSMKVAYRVVLSKKGKLQAIKIEEKEKDVKITSIIGKTLIKGGKVQLNLSDAKNILVKDDKYKVGDALVISEKNEIKEHLKFEKGATVLFIGGISRGTTAKIEDIQGDKVIVSNDRGTFETMKEYAFVVGKDKPVIMIA